MSDFEAVKQSSSLKVFAESNMERARRGNRYVCPFCGSGGRASADSDSAFSIMADGKRFKCFSCGRSGDVFDLAAQVWGIDANDKQAQLEAVAEWAGIPLSEKQHRSKEVPRPRGTVPVEKKTGDDRDYSDGRKREAERLRSMQAAEFPPELLSYLEARGYTEDDARSLGWGWDAGSRRLVIPWKGSSWYHIDRDVTGRAQHKYSKPKRDEVGPQPLYNPAALDAASFYVVEGAMDAAAIELCGYEAVALGGTAFSQLVSALDSTGRKPVAILALDRDEAGTETQERMAVAMKERHLPYRLMEWPDNANGKDADEVRRNIGGDALRAVLSRFSAKVDKERGEAEEEAYSAALQSLRVVSAGDIASDLYMMAGAVDSVPTGFKSLDSVTDGGLPIGLTVLGAVSSMGKTTLVLQTADQIAASGRPVLFVTIEQSARELVAMSLSRYTWKVDGGASGWAVSSSSIARPKMRAQWGGERNALLLAACEAYSAEVAPTMHIMEGTEQPSVSDIRAAAERIKRHDGMAPVVFVDYLQLLKAQDEHDDDKRATDKNVMALRQLSRDLQTAVVAISSLNRAAYYGGGIRLDSFKESGAVEYGSDLLLGLQPADMADKLDGMAEAKAKGEASKLMREHKGSARRECELVILKQRFGATPQGGVPFTFDALHSLFLEGCEDNSHGFNSVVDIR